MKSALLTPPAPLNSVGDAPAVDTSVRLWLDPTLKRQGTGDGVWWPYSSDAAAELPRLITEVDRRMSQITLRVDVPAGAWINIPYRISARGREVEVSCPLGTDPHVIVLTFAGGASVRLLVSAAGAEHARTAHSLAADLPTGAQETDWENEGGHVISQDAPRPAGRAGRQVPAPRMTVTDSCPLGHADRSATTTVRLAGEIDVCTSPSLRTRLMSTLESSTDLLVLDLSGVSFCDAAGLAVMVGIQRRARPLGITLALTAPRPAMSRLLHITGLDRSLPMVV